MNKDCYNKQIDTLIHEKNNIWGLLLLSGGGTFALIFSDKSQLNVIFLILGLIFTTMLFLIYLKKNDQIKFYLDKLKKEQ